jgi:hypothetical protein
MACELFKSLMSNLLGKPPLVKIESDLAGPIESSRGQPTMAHSSVLRLDSTLSQYCEHYRMVDRITLAGEGGGKRLDHADVYFFS